MRRALIPLVLLPLALAGCGKLVILAKPTSNTVSRFVFQNTGFRPTDVSCPSSVPAKVGQKLQCHFTGPDGKYVAYLVIKSVKGTRVNFQIQSQRVGQTVSSSSAEQALAAFVVKHTGVHPRDVTCPSGFVPLLGHMLTCHFTAPDGKYTASMVVASAHKGAIGYQIQTRRTG